MRLWNTSLGGFRGYGQSQKPYSLNHVDIADIVDNVDIVDFVDNIDIVDIVDVVNIAHTIY